MAAMGPPPSGGNRETLLTSSRHYLRLKTF